MKNNDQQLGSPNILFSGTTAELNALSAVQGMIAFDTTLGKQVVYDGSNWVESGGGETNYTPPISTDFTWFNQESATVTDEDDAMYMYAPASGDWDARVLEKSFLSTPFNIDLKIKFGIVYSVNYANGGIIIRNSSDGKAVVFGIAYVDGWRFVVDYLNSVTSYNNNYIRSGISSFIDVYLRFTDNGTNRIYSMSYDGKRFINIYSHANTTWCVADKIGMYINPGNGSYPCSMNFLHWEES